MSSDADAAAARAERKPVVIIVMGVAGTGKTTLARALSSRLHFPYVEGDALHPPANIAKMSAGHPLADADREPWLALLRTTAEHLAAKQQAGGAPTHPVSEPADVGAPLTADAGPTAEPAHAVAEPAIGEQVTYPAPPARPGVLVTCSALKAYYREILRGHRRPALGEPLTEIEPPHPDKLPTYFVYIRETRDVLLDRVAKRQGHYMKANMVDSQLETLETPEGEDGVIVVDMTDSTDQQVEKVLDALKDVVDAS